MKDRLIIVISIAAFLIVLDFAFYLSKNPESSLISMLFFFMIIGTLVYSSVKQVLAKDNKNNEKRKQRLGRISMPV